MATFTNGGILNCSSGEGREPPLVDQLSFLSFCSEEMLSQYVNSASYAGPCSHVSCREQLLGRRDFLPSKMATDARRPVKKAFPNVALALTDAWPHYEADMIR